MANTKQSKKSHSQKRTRKEEYARDPKGGKNHYANGHCGSQNDPGWYNRLRTLVTDVTKIPFNFQIGRRLEYDNSGSALLPYSRRSTPGVMALDYVICPGIANNASDGVNIAASAIFQKIRKDLSTYAPYASADVMMYVLAGDSLVTLYNYILRLFGIVNLYSSLNYNINASILHALGLSIEDQADFKANLNSYRSRFNNLIYKASTIYVPAQFSITERHAWLFSNLFTDANSVKGQIYLHDLAGIYILDETASEEGTQLTFYSKDDMLYNAEQSYMENILNAFDALIERFRNSDSMNKIAADMRRAYADVAAWQFAYCDENYIVPLVYSTEVLSQIENTTVLPGIDKMDRTSLNITQSVDKNIILFNPTWPKGTIANEVSLLGVSAIAWDNNQMLNAHTMEPSSDDIAVMTRNVVNLEYDMGTEAFRPSSLGSDFVIGCRMYAWDTYFGIVQDRGRVERFMSLPSQNVNPDATVIGVDAIGDYVAFDWAPMLFVCEPVDTDMVLSNARALIDYNNYTFISPESLDNMHNNIIASMWSVPQFGNPTK